MTPISLISGIAICLSLLTISAPISRAQFTSALEGTVTDPSGAVVPNAAVSLENIATGTTVEASTTDAGYFRFTALPAAVFTIKIESPGFRVAVRENIQVQVNDIRTVNVSLALEAASSEVTFNQ